MRKILYALSAIVIISILYIYFKVDLRVKLTEALDGRSFTSLKNNKIIHSFKTKKHLKRKSIIPDDIKSISEIKNLDIFYGNKKLDFKNDLYQKAQRYYLPIKEFCKQVNADFKVIPEGFKIEFEGKIYTISKEGKSISSQYKTINLRGESLDIKRTDYLSISDIEEIFSFISYWDTEDNKISFSPIDRTKIKSIKKDGVISLIRLEDVSVGENYNNGKNLLKLKLVSQYMDNNNLKFSIAWVPRYKNPPENIDIDLLSDFNITNAAFINTLDYIINRDGIIGLHGYTHQHHDEKSISSSELTKDVNTTEAEIINVVEASIKTADSLNIPYNFFESPHYGATEFQQSIVEKYFDYIYEPYVSIWNKLPLVSPRNNSTIYVPAPLSYIKGDNVQELLDKLKNNKSSVLASFFYHPYKEFDYIKFDVTPEGYLEYTYSEESPLNKINKTLDENGYVTIKITDIK